MVPVTGWMDRLELMHSGHGSGVFSARGPALLREADYRAPGSIFAPSLGMEETII